MSRTQDKPGGLFAPDPDLVEVSIGEIVVAEAPKRLLTPALGSCVGLAVYDVYSKRGGLAHIMLPGPSEDLEEEERGRFADYAVPQIVQRMMEAGSLRRRLEAKIAGGAAMFRGDSAIGTIGARNVAEVKQQLALMSVPLVAEDTGESYARTMEIRLDDGETQVRSFQFGVRRL